MKGRKIVELGNDTQKKPLHNNKNENINWKGKINMGLKNQKNSIDLVKELVSVSNSKQIVVSEDGNVTYHDHTTAYHKDKDDKGRVQLVQYIDTSSKDMCETDSQQTFVNNNIPDVSYNMDLGNSSEVRQQPVQDYGYTQSNMTQNDITVSIEPNTDTYDIGNAINVQCDNNTAENNTAIGTSSEIAQQQTYMFQGNAQLQSSNQGNKRKKTHQFGYWDCITLCQNSFSKIYRLVNHTKKGALNYIIIICNNNCTEPLIIEDKYLSKTSLIDKLQSRLMINMSNIGVPKTELASTIAQFLRYMANQNEEQHLYPNAGWIPHKKIFFNLHIENDDTLALELQRICSKLPVLKKTLKKPEQCLISPLFKDSRQRIYQLAFYGSILMTLLQEHREDTGFAIWMPNNMKSRKFVDVFFRIWENYQAQIDISQKVQLKNIINEAKDEPVIIYCNDNKQGAIENLKNLFDGVFSGTECAGMGKLNGVPIIISDNFFQLIEWTEEPKRILPLIVNTEEEFTREISSTVAASNFIKWCVDKYDLVTMILKTHTRATSEDSGLEKSFFAILMIVDIFLGKLRIEKIDDTMKSTCINRIQNKCKKLQDYLKRFLDNTETEMFGQWLSQCFTSGELTLKHNNDVTKSELNGKVVVYSDSGEVYFDEEAFKTVLKKGKIMDYDFMLKALAEQNSIQTEAKNNGSVTYKVKCAVPSGCGRNQRRMIKFHVGVLMDEEGAAFDGELLQDKKSSAVIKKPYYMEIGTRSNGKMLYYNPYSEGNTNAMVLITGKSGSGKTNFSYNVIRQAIKEEMIILVPDFSDSFEAGKVASLDNSRVFSVADFPASPFSKMTPDEDNEITARRCSNMLSRIFNMGVNQEKSLNYIILHLLKSGYPVTFSNIANAIKDTKDTELKSIERLATDGILNAFEKSDKGWTDLYTSSAGLYVIKFNERYTSQDKINCTELLLLSLSEWLHARGQENCNRKLQIHLDEAQNLRYSEKSPLTLLMRQGRKFECSVFLYTQSLFTFDKNVKEILEQAALLVNFQQTPQGAGKLAKLLEDDEKEAKELARQLKHLKKGQAIATGCFQKGNDIQTDTINVKVQTPLAESK